MLSFAILIDGGFARRKLGTSSKPATGDCFAWLISRLSATSELSQMHLHRVYYYDSAPLESSHVKPLGGETIEFGASPIASRSHALYKQLARQPYMALRLGELAFDGWVVNPKKLDKAGGPKVEITGEDLRPKITQKGVDMRIGMDIAALTLKRQAQVIVLVSGDSDFIPAMKFARREGAQLFLCPLGQRVRPIMHEHCDVMIDIDPKERLALS